MSNYIAYHYPFHKLGYEANKVLEEKITDKDLIVLKVPVLKHHVDEPEFEMISGDFVYEEKIYQMVKQKFDNDTLYIHCYTQKEAKLNTAFAEHTQANVNDSPRIPTKPKITSLDLLKDYLPKTIFHTSSIYCIPLETGNTSYSYFLSSLKNRITTPPPKLA